MNNLKNELNLYLKNNLEVEKTSGLFSKLKNAFYEEECEVVRDDEKKAKTCQSVLFNVDIDDFLEQHKKYSNFQSLLFKLIDERNLKDSDVYNKVHIDRRLFSKIRSDKNYHPSKETIILLALSLELSEEELDDLLESASYSLPKNNIYDLIIRFCFINKIFKLTDINELLNEHNCKLFSY